MGSRANQNKKHQQKPSTTPKGPFFHGGVPGLVVNGYLYPPNGHNGVALRKAFPGWRPNTLFVTTHQKLAQAYAYQFARLAPSAGAHGTDSLGTVYEVGDPKDLTVDPDFRPLAKSMGGAFSFYVKKPLRITNVINTVASNSGLEYKLLAPYQTWAPTPQSPGIHPLWTDKGYVRPNPTDALRGITWQALEKKFRLGPYPGQEALIRCGLYIQ